MRYIKKTQISQTLPLLLANVNYSRSTTASKHQKLNYYLNYIITLTPTFLFNKLLQECALYTQLPILSTWVKVKEVKK